MISVHASKRLKRACRPRLRRLLAVSAVALVAWVWPPSAAAAPVNAVHDPPPAGALGAAGTTPATAPEPSGRIVVYLIDHQRVSREELAAVQREIEAVFESQAGLHVDWVLDDSPRRQLRPEELRVLILASDGTRWFHGPSNVIGLAPHDDEAGIGRNCFVFYRQALWFRQQAVLRCREATRMRTQAQASGTAVDPAVDQIAPADCGSFLPFLTPLIVARAAAHEMVHILLNKLDHSAAGLMRDSFDLQEWLGHDAAPFRLLPEEIAALRARLGTDGAQHVSER